jgi:2,6-dihydroxypseudooxynicotine hydrolase
MSTSEQINSITPEVTRMATRLLHFGVTYADFRAASAGSSWEEFGQVLLEKARRYERLADEAEATGRVATAVAGLRRAAAYFHFAGVNRHELDVQHALRWRVRRAYQRLAPLLSPVAEPLDVTFAGQRLPGWLRVAREGAPCVVLLNGLDSAQEVELATFAEGFLERGLSVYTFEGPGQGTLAGILPLTCFDEAFPAVVETLRSHRSVGAAPLGVFGMSFGGYLACRVAAGEPRVAACVSLGGFQDGRVLPRLPLMEQALVRRAYGVAPDAPLQFLQEQVSLAPLAGKLKCPLLVVHGSEEPLVDMVQVNKLLLWARGLTRVNILEGSEHVCTDRFGECLPVMWDWMADTLKRLQAPVSVRSGDLGSRGRGQYSVSGSVSNHG